MSYLLSRPLALSCAVFLLSGVIFSEAGALPKLISAAAAAAAFIICLVIPAGHRRERHTAALALAALVLSALLSLAALELPEKRAAELTGCGHTVSGYITEAVLYSDYLSVYEARLTLLDGEKSNMKLQLTASFPLELEPGECFEAEALFGLFAESADGYPEARIMRSRGIFSSAEIITLERSGDSAGTLMLLPSKLRARLSAAVSSLTGGEPGGLVRALLIGERSGLTASLKRDFRALGLSHIIALSGLHLAILLGGAEKLLKLLTCPRPLRILLLCAGAALFAAVTGASLSVVRAALMFIIYQLSFLFGERRDQISALLLSVTLICIFSPSSISDCALQLSFAAALGMAAAGRLFVPRTLALIRGDGIPRRAARAIAAPLIYSLSATVFTLPLSWLYFARVSLVSPFFTLLAAPLVTVILTAAPIMLILSPLPALAAFPAALCKLCAHLIITLSGAAASPGMTVSLAYPFAGVIIALTAAAVAVMFILNVGKAAAYALAAASGAAAFALCLGIYGALNAGITDISFVTHKSNEAVCLSHRGETILCDLSDGSRSVVRAAAGLLQSRVYDDAIDAYMLTHYHRRHLSTFYYLTQSEFITRIILPEPVGEDELMFCTELLKLAEENGVEPVFYRRGGSAAVFAGVAIETIERSMLARSTHPLLALKLTGKGESLIYAGSSAASAAEALGDAAIVVFGAHGPKLKELFSSGDGDALCVFLSEEVYLMRSYGRADAIDPCFRRRIPSYE